jgi:ribokinase
MVAVSERVRPTVISIGDVATDVFIRLLADQAESYVDERGRWLAMPFGVKLPFDHTEIFAAAGNASNAAAAFVRLGLPTALVSNIGADHYGRSILETLAKNGVDTRLVVVSEDRNSNCHYVLWWEDERTILTRHEEYAYVWPQIAANALPDWVYFTSVCKHAGNYHERVADWLDANPQIQLAFQPGTFQIETGVAALRRIYARAALLILNREEAVTVGGGAHGDVHDLFDRLHALGPPLVVITDGPAGAYASSGAERRFVPAFPAGAAPVDRTGAGDAFASTFVAALIKGASVERALCAASANATSVVQDVGTQSGLLNEAALDEWLRGAPASYCAEPLQRPGTGTGAAGGGQ